MNKKQNKYWENQLNKICSIFGFSLKQRFVQPSYLQAHINNDLILKHNRSTVMYKDVNRTWPNGELEMNTVLLDSYEDTCKNLIEKMSGKELIFRGTETARESDWGFTRIRTERHIKLPEFSSAEELKLKLEISK